jgi:phosphatidylglycerol:prolipoprotein diacylglycerol transferase
VTPELFSLFGVEFPSYFVLLFTGFLFATACGTAWARRVGEDGDVIVDLGISMLIWGIVGARVLHVLADGFFWDYVHLCTDPSKVDWPVDIAECHSDNYRGVWDSVRKVCHPAERDCFAWAKFWAGGLTYYGGFIGACVAAVVQLRKDRFPFWKAADMAGFTVPLGLAFGRVGCLLAGCCFGAPSDAPWAISFPPWSPASEAQAKAGLIAHARMTSLYVHPTQMYEAVAALAVSAVCLFVIHPRKRYDGQVFAAFLALYAAARFAIEVLRRDDRGGVLGLSTSQAIGVTMLVVAAGIHLRRRFAPASQPVHTPRT